ncbi:zinc transporter ZIP2-like [Suncus etruscus]|uniref:zinc transporter ZIP2-like n=1 Tax=Suncus etruscus TaxID=109475 RepID=UPI0021106CF9|nr:zinc transporter ZIP2-like [Suncus etruscus]
MEALLGVKLGCMIGLLALTMVCGLLPIYIKWFKIDAATGRHRRILSLLGCISAGVFLGAGFMHMTAEALEGFEDEMQKLLMQNSSAGEENSEADDSSVEYPYGELIICLGFFFVFLLESLALQCCPGTAGGSTHHEEECGEIRALNIHSRGPKSSSSQGPLRALILLLSLSFHSVFEGLAVGLQPTIATTVQLCLAVLAHKGLVVFGVGLRLVQIGKRSQWAMVSIVTLSLMSPLGLAAGLAMVQGDSEGGQGLAQVVLEGFSAGTFLYVTFLEILPREFAGSGNPLAKWVCVAAGFAFMAFIALWA